MNMIRNTVARKSAWLSTIALVAAMHLGESALAQATSRPPDRMTYQGFIAGSDGVALGNTAPKNYDVIFRIYDAESGGAPMWGEQQTVTVDKGYFSVLLGEGAATPGTPNAGITLSSLFNSASASDRYVGFTVKGVGSGGADVEILPRVRLMSSPYAFLATKALSANTAATAVKLVQEANGADLLSGAGADLSLNGNLLVNAGKYLQLGVGDPGKEGNAGMISYKLQTPDSLEFIGAGTTPSNRKITFIAEGGSTFNGPINVGPTQIRQGSGVDGIVFGNGNTKEYPLNGSITYGSSNGSPTGEESLWIQGGGNTIAKRSVQVYADGGLYVYGPLSIPVGGPIHLGYNATKDASNGKIGYGLFTANALDIVGGGTSVGLRRTQIHGNVIIAGGGSSLYPLEIGGFQNGSGVGLRVNSQIQATAYQTISDRRTKDIVGTTSHPQDIEKIRALHVVDYRWKAHPNKDRRLVKGVVAQELLPIMPDAITVSANTVPCERMPASRVEWLGAAKPLMVEFAEGHGLSGGDRIHLEVDGKKTEATVDEAPDAKSIRVMANDLATKPQVVVLVGREVKDFLTVDYQQVYMTAVSALQEVDRRLQAVDQRVQEVEKRELRVAELEKKAAARVEGLEREMAELRKLVAGIQSAKAKTESASVTPAASSVAVANAR